MAIADERTLTYLVQVERLAEEILADKHTLLSLDMKLNELRLAIGELSENKRPQPRKCWMVNGQVFLRCPVPGTVAAMKRTRDLLLRERDDLRAARRDKLDKLADLEMKPPVPGLSLRPLGTDELAAFKPKR